MARVVLRAAGIVAAVEAAIMVALPRLGLPPAVAAWADPVAVTVASGPLVYWWVVRPYFSRLRDLYVHQHAEAGLRDYESGLRQAFEMAFDEAAAIEVTHHVLSGLAPTGHSELLLADASEAHLTRVMSLDPSSSVRPVGVAARAPGSGPDGDAGAAAPTTADAGCPVESPWSCPAVVSGRTRVFADPSAVNACPQLRLRAVPVAAAACLPVTSRGRALGVLHVTSPDPADFDSDTVERLKMLGGQAGAGIGMRRAFDRTQVQADTDSLTGLLNRRCVEDKARTRLTGCGSYAAIMLDLDHFKQLNDVHGHDAGDRAIRATARILRQTTRDKDLVARYGGEEFLLLLPGADEEVAMTVAERIRLALAHAAATGNDQMTTASLGVAVVAEDTVLADAVRACDRALLDAKRAGRNRVHTTATPPADNPAAGADPLAAST